MGPDPKRGVHERDFPRPPITTNPFPPSTASQRSHPMSQLPPPDWKKPKRLTPLRRVLIEVGSIVFLYYSNLLMGEFERSGAGRSKGLAWALGDIFTMANLEIAVIAAQAERGDIAMPNAINPARSAAGATFRIGITKSEPAKDKGVNKPRSCGPECSASGSRRPSPKRA